MESRNRLPTQADDAARSEFERAPQRETNHALPTAASPKPSEAKPRFSLNNPAIDDSPIRRYSSRQRKRLFKFPIRIDKIRFYLNNDMERVRIARNAYQRVIRDYRIKKLLRQVGEIINEASK